MQAIVNNPVVLVIATVALYLGGQWAWRAIKAALATRETAEQERTAALVKLAEAISSAAIQSAASNAVIVKLEAALLRAADLEAKMLPGVIKACEAIAEATDKHRTGVAEFGKMVFGPNAGKDALAKPSEEDKDRIYAEMQYRAAGKSAEEAHDLASIELANDGAGLYPTG